jgi:Holliday junction DNA helicase RuvB
MCCSSGRPGLGKTTLAQIVARELGVNFRATSGPVIAKAGDLAALLTNLEERDVLFIDEIHRLNPQVEEILYPAMEDFQLDLIIGEGPAARSVKIDLSKFTLVGATTRARPADQRRCATASAFRSGSTSIPSAELEQIVRAARACSGSPHAERRRQRDRPPRARHAAHRGTAAAALARFRRCRRVEAIDAQGADKALPRLEVDGARLDQLDRRYLTTIALNFGGGPVGIETIAAALSEPRDAIEDIIEPYLIQQGFVQRTPRGRRRWRRLRTKRLSF